MTQINVCSYVRKQAPVGAMHQNGGWYNTYFSLKQSKRWAITVQTEL